MIINDLTMTLTDQFYQWSEDTDAYLNEPDFLLRKKKKRLNLPSPSTTDNEDAPSESSNQISIEQDVPPYSQFTITLCMINKWIL